MPQDQPVPSERIRKPFQVGQFVAHGRARMRLSQEELANRLGISRKTLSDLERGVSTNISLSTALDALAQTGFVVEVSEHRPPQIDDVMAARAAQLVRLELAIQPTLKGSKK